MHIPFRLSAILLILAAGQALAAPKPVPPPRTGNVHYSPPADETGVPERFKLAEHDFAFEQEFLPSSSKKLELSLVTFPSPIKSPHENNNTVHCEYFRPTSEGKHPGVIVLHILGGDFELSRLCCRQFSTNGIASLFVKLPYYGPREQPDVERQMISASPQETAEGFTQAVVDIRRAAAWLAAQGEVDPDDVGIMGISLGGITGSLALTAEPRFQKAFLMLAGGEVALIGLNSPEAEKILGSWKAEGGDEKTLIELLKPIDPVSYGKNVHGRKIIMYNATQDEIIPRACTDSLWESFGKPEIHWVEAGHYSVARYMFDALGRATRLFQGLPSQPPKALPAPAAQSKPAEKLEAAAIQ
jgi:dienelactone hydrolase